MPEKNNLILILFFSLVFIYIFDNYIFSSLYFFFKDIGSDTINFNYNYSYAVFNQLKNNLSYTWHFDIGMGMNYFPYLTNNPLIIFSILFSNSSFPYIITIIEISKIILIFWVGYLYFNEILKKSHSGYFLLFPLIFSSFAILGGTWLVFLNEMLIFSMILLSFEHIINRNNYTLFTISIFLILIVLPFDIYLFGVFFTIYFILRIVQTENTIRSMLPIIIRMATFMLIGIGISCVFSFSFINMMLNSPRVGGESSYQQILKTQPVFRPVGAVELQTIISRFFSSDLLGTGSNFRGYNNYLEAPMTYIGIITLLLFPMVFQFINRKQKIVYGAVLALWGLILTFPYFRWAFWLFTGDYYRILSLFISFTLLFMSMKAINGIIEKGKIHLITLLVTLGVLLGLLFFPYPTNIQPESDLQIFIAVLLVLYSALIYLLNNKKYQKYILITITLLVGVEVAYMSNITVNKRDVLTADDMKSKTGYNDYTIEAVNYLKTIDNSFYRIEKDYTSGPAIHGSLNDAMVQGYYGTTSYSSFNQLYYIKFLAGMKVIDPKNEFQTRWAPGVRGRLLLQSLVGVKYRLCKSDWVGSANINFIPLKKFGNVTIYENKNYLPLGVAFSKYIAESDFRLLNEVQSDFMSLHAVVVPDSIAGSYSYLRQLGWADTTRDLMTTTYNAIVDSTRKGNTMHITHFAQNNIRGEITVATPKLLFLAIPWDKGWHATVDGQPTNISIVDYGLMGIKLEPGSHKIELSYQIPYFYPSLGVSLASICIFIGLIVWDRKKKKS